MHLIFPKSLPGSELEATEGGGKIEIVEHGRRWVHCRVLDPESKRPTPVRLAFRSKDGRYIPPYGHRAEINDGWFQDYGADVKLMDTSFAYVDGTFQVELPPGEVYLEMTKGFEHQAVRQKIDIQPGQRELTLEIPRFTNLRAKGWVTADTHTHFLSPTTAVLEAQAEGLNLINLLAAQWGDLFTNVGDLSYGPLLSRGSRFDGLGGNARIGSTSSATSGWRACRGSRFSPCRRTARARPIWATRCGPAWRNGRTSAASARAWRWRCISPIPRVKSPPTSCSAKSMPWKFGRKTIRRFIANGH